MAEKTYKCHGCKQIFPEHSLVKYSTSTGLTSYRFCQKCFNEKQERDKFNYKVCEIFGIKSPGPRIWTERKRLQLEYGYTDNVLIDCLDYLYKVKNLKRLADSLCLINPTTVNEMIQYKKAQQYNAEKIVSAIKMDTIDYIVPMKSNNESSKKKIDPNDFLDD